MPGFVIYIFIIFVERQFKVKLSFIFQVDRNHDYRILGHLPYKEIPKEKLVLIEPNIEVHIDMRESLLKMREEAKKDGIYLVFLSGYRSINLQNNIFYSLKSIRNQDAAEILAKSGIKPWLFERKLDNAKPCGGAIPLCMVEELEIVLIFFLIILN